MKLKLIPFTAVTFSSFLTLSHADATVSMSMEERKASVVNLESQVEARDIRLEEVKQDIKTLDGRIEKRIDALVKALSNTRDSQSSKTRISKLKQDAIQGLRHGIEIYAAKRREMAERIKTGDDAALNDLKAFDLRISTRVAQIVELSKSFPPSEDVEKYKSDGDGGGDGHYWRGYYGNNDNTRISEEWKQNRRDGAQTKVQKDQIIEAIKAGISRLEQRQSDLVNQLHGRTIQEDTRKLYTQELGSISAQLENLNGQLTEMAMPGGSTATVQPSLDEAVTLEQYIKDARQDLRSDVTSLFQLYDAYDKERSRVGDMKSNLSARKAWLEQNAPATK